MPDDFNPGLSGLDTVKIDRPGQPSTYERTPSSHGLGIAFDQAFHPERVPVQTSTDDLIGNAVAARQQINARRQTLVQQLPYASRRQRYAITAELHGLDKQDQFTEWQANQHRIEAHTNAIESDKAIRRDRDTRIDEQGADAMMKMHGLDNALRSGQITKEQFDDGMLELGSTHAEALHRHPEAAKHWASYLDQDHRESQYQQRLNLREASKLSTKYGVPLRVGDNGEIDFEAMRNAALATPKGQAEALHTLNAEMEGRYSLPLPAVFEHAEGGIGSDKDFKATDPNDTKNPQTHVRMSIAGQGGVVHQVTMEKPRFDAIKNEFQPAYNAIVSAAQTPTAQPQPAGAVPSPGQPAAPAADPRIPLAQKALNDPNASEAHKAAARQILGIQDDDE